MSRRPYQFNDGLIARGSMVTDTDGRVIGMVTDTDTSTPLVIPTSTMTKVLDTNGVTSTLGSLDRTYRKGLDAYFGGRYGEAFADLDAVLAATPDNAVARTYRGRAADLLGAQNAGTRRWTAVVVAILGVNALILGAVGRRRRAEFMYFDPYPGPVSMEPAPGPEPFAPPDQIPTDQSAPPMLVPISAVPAAPDAPVLYVPEPIPQHVPAPLVVPVPPSCPAAHPESEPARPETPWGPRPAVGGPTPAAPADPPDDRPVM